MGKSHSRIFGGTHGAYPHLQAVNCLKGTVVKTPVCLTAVHVARNAGLRDRWPPFRELFSYLDPDSEAAVFLGQLVGGLESVEIIHGPADFLVVGGALGVFQDLPLGVHDFPVMDVASCKNSSHNSPQFSGHGEIAIAVQ